MPSGTGSGEGFPQFGGNLAGAFRLEARRTCLSTFTVWFKHYLKLIPYQYPCRIEVRVVDRLDMSESFATIENKEARPNLLEARKGVIRVLIADDHPIVRDGLNKLLSLEEDVQVVGEASDGCEVLDKVQELDPDVLLLDLRMPNLDGLSRAASAAANQQAHPRDRPHGV